MIDDLTELLPEFVNDMVFNPWESEQGVIGNPSGGSEWLQQSTDFTCAVVSQQMILKDFGFDVSEAQLVYDSVSNGWLSDQGTTIEDMGELLNYYGIPTHQGLGDGIESLLSELAQGHKVIVGVDSGELWATDFPFSDWIDGGNGADHAIVVNGIDTSDPSNIMVYVNDPGDPVGAGRAYPLKQFMDAWDDSGRFYVSTSAAPENLSQHTVFGANFDDGWYFSPDAWSDIGKSLVSDLEGGYDTGKTVFDWTGSLELASIAGGAHAGYAVFSTIVDQFSESDLDSFLKMI
jgi:hypothetical protein